MNTVRVRNNGQSLAVVADGHLALLKMTIASSAASNELTVEMVQLLASYTGNNSSGHYFLCKTTPATSNLSCCVHLRIVPLD